MGFILFLLVAIGTVAVLLGASWGGALLGTAGFIGGVLVLFLILGVIKNAVG